MLAKPSGSGAGRGQQHQEESQTYVPHTEMPSNAQADKGEQTKKEKDADEGGDKEERTEHGRR